MRCPRLTNTRVMTPERSDRTGIHSIGSTLPLVLSELTTVSRVTLMKSTSGGAAFLVATHAAITAAPTRRIASQLRLRLTNGSSDRGQVPFSQNLFQHHQRIAGAHCVAVAGSNLDDSAGPGGLHFVLHLHGFHHHQTLPYLHGISDVDQHANHFAWHRRGDVLAARSDRCARASAGVARIADFDAERPPARLRLQSLKRFV